MEETEANRRPLRSRERWWSRLLLSALLKTPVTPNQVSIASIGFACLAGAGFMYRDTLSPVLMLICAIVGMQGRLVCNLMDGMLAVEGQRESSAGDLYNELPDRFSDIIILVAAGYGYTGSSTGIVHVATLGWIAALLAVLTAYVRVFGASVGAGHLFLGPMAKQHRMALLTVACVIELFLICFRSDISVIPFSLICIVIGCGITIYRRLQRIRVVLQNKNVH